MSITIIAAVGRNSEIGRGGDLAFHISADLKRFKSLTTGHTVIMGRKTFLSLPKGALPQRRNIVLTTDPAFTAPGIETAPTLEAALDMAAGTEIFIIGGGTVYIQAMPRADVLQLTHVHADDPDADTYFPAVDPAAWQLTDSDGPLTDPRSGLSYTFATYRRP